MKTIIPPGDVTDFDDKDDNTKLNATAWDFYLKDGARAPTKILGPDDYVGELLPGLYLPMPAPL
jgi:hypothetical protein